MGKKPGQNVVPLRRLPPQRLSPEAVVRQMKRRRPLGDIAPGGGPMEGFNPYSPDDSLRKSMGTLVRELEAVLGDPMFGIPTDPELQPESTTFRQLLSGDWADELDARQYKKLKQLLARSRAVAGTDTLEKYHEILVTLHRGLFMSGEGKDAHQLLDRVHALVCPPENARLRVLRAVRAVLRFLPSAQEPKEISFVVAQMLEALTQVSDAFGKLTSQETLAVLQRGHLESPGGEGKWGPPRVAAELSVMCTAKYDSIDGKKQSVDTDVDKAKRAFIEAESSAGGIIENPESPPETKWRQPVNELPLYEGFDEWANAHGFDTTNADVLALREALRGRTRSEIEALVAEGEAAAEEKKDGET